MDRGAGERRQVGEGPGAWTGPPGAVNLQGLSERKEAPAGVPCPGCLLAQGLGQVASRDNPGSKEPPPPREPWEHSCRQVPPLQQSSAFPLRL